MWLVSWSTDDPWLMYKILYGNEEMKFVIRDKVRNFRQKRVKFTLKNSIYSIFLAELRETRANNTMRSKVFLTNFKFWTKTEAGEDRK